MSKKNHTLILIGLAMIMLLMFSGCSEDKNAIDPSNTAGTNESMYLEDMGYNIVKENGKISSYVLEKAMLTELPYSNYWGLQEIDIQPYIGKQIDTYSFIVDNHPLDQMGDLDQTKVWLMICENEIVGGYSLQNTTEMLDGGVYSLNGRTLEEVNNIAIATPSIEASPSPEVTSSPKPSDTISNIDNEESEMNITEGILYDIVWGDYLHLIMHDSDNIEYDFFILKAPGVDPELMEIGLAIRAFWQNKNVYFEEQEQTININELIKLELID